MVLATSIFLYVSTLHEVSINQFTLESVLEYLNLDALDTDEGM